MKRIVTAIIALAALGAAFVLPVAPASASAVIDEGGYYNVHAYGWWVFEHDVHGAHHCC